MVKQKASDETLLSGLFAAQVASEMEAEAEARRIAAEAARDHLAERLVTDGIFPNLYQVEHDGAIAAWRTDQPYPAPWNLPSRLFRFPAYTERGPDGIRRIAVLHPLLLDHPLIVSMLARGYELSSADACVNEHGVSIARIHPGTWWHAVDLIHSHPRQLLETRRFTTDADLAAAVSYRCSYPHEKGPLTSLLREVREVMSALDAPEPHDDAANVLALFDKPVACQSDGSGKRTRERWPINASRCHANRAHLAWGYIHGIENGWFENENGYLHWSKKGRTCWTQVRPCPGPDAWQE